MVLKDKSKTAANTPQNCLKFKNPNCSNHKALKSMIVNKRQLTRIKDDDI